MNIYILRQTPKNIRWMYVAEKQLTVDASQMNLVQKQIASFDSSAYVPDIFLNRSLV